VISVGSVVRLESCSAVRVAFCQFIDPATEDVVDTEDQVKGYALGKDNFITVEDKELDAIKIESTRTIDTLRYASEVRDAAAYFEDIPEIKLTAEMKELAEVIIDGKAAHFDPAKFEDRYENAVIDLLKTKEAGLPAPAQKPEPRPHNVINIMDALRRSIEAEKAAPPRAAEAVEKRKAPSKTPGSGKSQAPTKRRAPRKAAK
jgi:non-homologous end joining protein Ku